MTPVFYGWVILAAGTIGSVMLGPSQTFTVGIFIDAFIADLGLSRSTISLIYGIATFTASLMLPITGTLFDRYGARRIIIMIALGLGCACLLIGAVQGAMTLFVGMLILRFSGFGSMQLVSNNVIALWFIRQRGLVMGIAGQSLGVSLLIYPSLGLYLSETFGWRLAWAILGLFVMTVMLPVGWLFFRDTPEQYGLLPDGDLDKHDTRSTPVEINWTLQEARQTTVFWLFATALSTMTLLLAGLVFHQISLFDQRGLTETHAIHAFTMMALTSVIANLSMGRLLDRYSARWLLSGVMLLIIAALSLVQMMVLLWHALVYGVLLGLISGSFRVIDSVIWAKYFGRLHLGEIRGATMTVIVGATAFGPYLLGASFDYLGSYTPILTGMMMMPITICILAPFVNRPEKTV